MKYTHDFRSYNHLKKEIVDENEVLKSIKLFYQAIPAKITQPLFKDAKLLAEYAFKEYTTYYITFYSDEKPFVCVRSGNGTFDIQFLDTTPDGLVYRYLIMTFYRVNFYKMFYDNIYEPLPNNQIFLNQVQLFIDTEFETTKRTMFFKKSDKNNPTDLLEITETGYLKKEEAYKKKIEETTKVNLSNNYFRAPKHYFDYEYLFDYEKLLKPEYFHLNSEIKDKTKF